MARTSLENCTTPWDTTCFAFPKEGTEGGTVWVVDVGEVVFVEVVVGVIVELGLVVGLTVVGDVVIGVVPDTVVGFFVVVVVGVVVGVVVEVDVEVVGVVPRVVFGVLVVSEVVVGVVVVVSEVVVVVDVEVVVVVIVVVVSFESEIPLILVTEKIKTNNKILNDFIVCISMTNPRQKTFLSVHSILILDCLFLLSYTYDYIDKKINHISHLTR